MITPENSHQGVNIAVHMWILFVFLTVFFFTFIAKTERKADRSELSDIIKKETPIVFDSLDKAAGDYIQWNKINDIAEKIKTRYKGKDPLIDQHNNKLLKTAIIICGAFLFIIIAVIMYFTLYKKYHIGLKEILSENLLITVLVGIVEAVFFFNITLKFVPVTTSDLITDLVDRTEYQINKQLS